MNLNKHKILTHFALISIFFSGCAHHATTVAKEEASHTYTVLIKTPKLKFHDTAFVNETSDMVALQAYQSGQAMLELEVGNSVCVNKICMDKSRFNSEFLVSSYHKGLIGDVLRGDPIWDGHASHPVKGGFVQHLKSPTFFIQYEVVDGKISFKDEKNGIKIKLTPNKMQGNQ